MVEFRHDWHKCVVEFHSAVWTKQDIMAIKNQYSHSKLFCTTSLAAIVPATKSQKRIYAPDIEHDHF